MILSEWAAIIRIAKYIFLLEFLLSIYKTIKYHLDRLPPKKLVQQNNLSIP